MTTTPEVRLPAPLAETTQARGRGFWRVALLRLRRQPVTLFALFVLVSLLVTGAVASKIAPEGWNWINLSTEARNHAPTVAGGNLMGTDALGRNVLVRAIWGLHFSEQVAVVGALLAVVIGLVVGLLAGYYGGFLDAVLMRLVDLVAGFPVLILMIIAFTYFEPVTLWRAVVVLACSLWTFVARVVRARVASLRPEEFVQAARAVGASDARIILRHLLPNTAGTLVVSFTSLIGQIAIVEATAEFFGFGVNSGVRPTLGNLIAEYSSSGIGAYNLFSLGWWTWGGCALVLVLLLLSVNLVGDGLEAALDPRRGRG